MAIRDDGSEADVLHLPELMMVEWHPHGWQNQAVSKSPKSNFAHFVHDSFAFVTAPTITTPKHTHNTSMPWILRDSFIL